MAPGGKLRLMVPAKHAGTTNSTAIQMIDVNICTRVMIRELLFLVADSTSRQFLRDPSQVSDVDDAVRDDVGTWVKADLAGLLAKGQLDDFEVIAVNFAVSVQISGDTIGEGTQERDDGKLLPVVQSKIPHLGSVDVVCHFWQRPSRAGNVPRVVEVNDLLQRLEVAIVAVRLHKIPGWPQVHVAQGWNLMLAPFSHVIRRRITRSLEEAAQTRVNPGRAGRIPLGLIVERVQRLSLIH